MAKPGSSASADERSMRCERCERRAAAYRRFGGAGPAARCWWCFVRDRRLVRRAGLTALVVGTVLTAINQGNVLLSGELPAALWWKVPLTYLVPYSVTTWGALSSSRV